MKNRLLILITLVQVISLTNAYGQGPDSKGRDPYKLTPIEKGYQLESESDLPKKYGVSLGASVIFTRFMTWFAGHNGLPELESPRGAKIANGSTGVALLTAAGLYGLGTYKYAKGEKMVNNAQAFSNKDLPESNTSGANNLGNAGFFKEEKDSKK